VTQQVGTGSRCNWASLLQLPCAHLLCNNLQAAEPALALLLCSAAVRLTSCLLHGPR
jgi:hypothetical protein